MSSPDRHLTDEEIHEAAGQAPRDVPGMPQANCLSCGAVFTPYYAAMAHDCVVRLAEKAPYWLWLLRFQKWGMGVLRTPADRKFPSFDRSVISGRSMLTQHLQADINVGHGEELLSGHYGSSEFREAGFPAF